MRSQALSPAAQRSRDAPNRLVCRRTGRRDRQHGCGMVDAPSTSSPQRCPRVPGRSRPSASVPHGSNELPARPMRSASAIFNANHERPAFICALKALPERMRVVLTRPFGSVTGRKEAPRGSQRVVGDHHVVGVPSPRKDQPAWSAMAAVGSRARRIERTRARPGLRPDAIPTGPSPRIPGLMRAITSRTATSLRRCTDRDIGSTEK